jgi:hypothetical protein
MRITVDQAKIEEKLIIQTTMALNVEVEKIGDIGETADPLEIIYYPADIFLLLLTFPFFATHTVSTHI